MHVLEPSALIILLAFSAAGLIAVLAAVIVTADKMVGAWHQSEPVARGGDPRGSRCANAGRKPKRSAECPVIGGRKQR